MKLAQENPALKILIADDDPDDRQLLALAFREAQSPHIIKFVNNGEELMDHLESLIQANTAYQLPDLILLDLNMPKKDGRVALKEIRSNQHLHKLNIIVFSTSISSEDNKFVTELAVINCITKPCGFYELVDTVKNICNLQSATPVPKS